MILLTWYSFQFKFTTIEMHSMRIDTGFNNICCRSLTLTEDRKLIVPHGNIFDNYMLPPFYAWSKNIIEDINNETEDTMKILQQTTPWFPIDIYVFRAYCLD